MDYRHVHESISIYTCIHAHMHVCISVCMHDHHHSAWILSWMYACVAFSYTTITTTPYQFSTTITAVLALPLCRWPLGNTLNSKHILSISIYDTYVIYTYTYMNPTLTFIHACMCAYAYIQTCVYIPTFMHACMCVYVLASMHMPDFSYTSMKVLCDSCILSVCRYDNIPHAL